MKVHLRTFGCRANHYDSEMVRALAVNAGHEIVDDVSDADVAVFNSCAVTSEAERDVRKAVRRAGTRNPRLRSIVMGCAAALPASQPGLRALPTVAHVIPGNDVAAIGEALGIDLRHARPLVAQSSVRGLLRVQDGCDEHCTFCATTLARGANRSRPEEELVREASQLAEHHPEIVITGTHIGSYGADSGSSLGQLMMRLIRDVPRVRFRLSSVEATEVDDVLRELFTEPSRLAPYLHAPLQSGSDRVLRRMGRHWYTAESYGDAIELLTRDKPVFGLGADIIVGFPGETDQDFEATVAQVERLPFTYLHVFTYSPRPGTSATRLADHVSLSEAQARSAHLRHLGQAKGNEYKRSRVGTNADAVVISAAGEREAMTEDYLTLPLRGAARPRGDRFMATVRVEDDILVCHSEHSEESAVNLPADPSSRSLSRTTADPSLRSG